MRILLVSTWGFPGNWKSVNYILPVPPRDTSKWGKLVEWSEYEELITSRSVTFAQACALKKIGYDIKVEIFYLDTLAIPSKPHCQGDDELCNRCMEKLVKIGCIERSSDIKYDDILEKAREVLHIYLDAFFEETNRCLEYNEVETVIVPGTGGFKCGLNDVNLPFNFKGSPFNAYAFIRLRMNEILTENQDGFDAVILDVSHGINYLPVLAREAVLRSVEAYAALSERTIGYALLNSDPPRPDSASMVHVVDAKSISCDLLEAITARADFLENNRNYVRMLVKSRPPEASMIIKEIGNKYRHTFSAISMAYNYGLLLYLITKIFKNNSSDMTIDLELLKKTIKDILKTRIIKLTGNEIIVEHEYVVERETMELLEFLELFNNFKSIFLAVDRVQVNGTVMFELDSMKSLAEKIGLSNPGKILFYKELSNIKNDILLGEAIGVDFSKPISYDLLIKIKNTPVSNLYDCEKQKIDANQLLKQPEYWSTRHPSCKADRRNYLAHAGFERNTIAVLVKGEKIYLGYGPGCFDELKKII